MTQIESIIEELAGSIEQYIRPDFPLMPEGQAVDMGHAEDGTPLLDPRILDSPAVSHTGTRHDEQAT